MASVIRIVDVFNVHIPPNLPADAVPQIVLTLFVAFKAPDGPGGTYRVTVRLYSPSGNEIRGKDSTQSFPVVLTPEQLGVNLIMNVALATTEFGRFAFHVLVDDEEITRVPFILQQQIANGSTAKQ